MAEANHEQPEDTRIVFRVGLHFGDVIVDGDDLYGDGVNIAARLLTTNPFRECHRSNKQKGDKDQHNASNCMVKSYVRQPERYRAKLRVPALAMQEV
jgi:hypothetical protein